MANRKVMPVAPSIEECQAAKDHARLQGVSASALLREGLRIVLRQPIKKPSAS